MGGLQLAERRGVTTRARQKTATIQKQPRIRIPSSDQQKLKVNRFCATDNTLCCSSDPVATIGLVPTVVAAITDVFFLAKVHDAIKAAGAEMKLARTGDEALGHARAGASLLLLDLNDRSFAALDLA